jgi:hypothetical protein
MPVNGFGAADCLTVAIDPAGHDLHTPVGPESRASQANVPPPLLHHLLPRLPQGSRSSVHLLVGWGNARGAVLCNALDLVIHTSSENKNNNEKKRSSSRSLSTAVELRLGPSDISCTLSCIRESKASVNQACQTETDDNKLGAKAASR